MRTPDWQSSDGAVRLYQGDALEVLPTLPEASIDLLCTDPPYSSGGQFRGDRMASTRTKYQTSGDLLAEHPCFSGDNRDQRGWAYWCALWLAQCQRAMVSGAVACVFTDWRQLPTATDLVQAGGWVWRGIVPWDKVNARPQADRFRAQAEFIVWATNGPRESIPSADSVYLDGVLRVTTVPADDREHSTQKPVELMTQLMPLAPHGGTVLDPFMGVGSTGVAAAKTGRAFVGCELSPDYFAVAVRRIQAAIDEGALYRQAEREPDPELFAADLAAEHEGEA